MDEHERALAEIRCRAIGHGIIGGIVLGGILVAVMELLWW